MQYAKTKVAQVRSNAPYRMAQDELRRRAKNNKRKGLEDFEINRFICTSPRLQGTVITDRTQPRCRSLNKYLSVLAIGAAHCVRWP
jgi:hypothetical protein